MDLNSNHLALWPVDLVMGFSQFLEDQLSRILNQDRKTRPWHFWELHNPWSRAATIVDSWRFLDLCQSSEILNHVVDIIGPDVILFDSRIVTYYQEYSSELPEFNTDHIYYPVSPPSGLTVRIPIGARKRNTQFVYKTVQEPHHAMSLVGDAVEIGQNIIAHQPDLQFRLESRGKPSPSYEYLIRYFSANSQFNRDTHSRQHRMLTELSPHLNYAKLPLWLVSGTDKADNDFVTGFSTKIGRWI